MKRFSQEFSKEDTLVTCVGLGYIDQVGARLDSGVVDVNCRDTTGMTPLVAAVQPGRREMVMLLLNRGADVNATTGGNLRTTPIIEAVKKRELDLVELLLEHGADPYKEDGNGMNAVQHAMSLGYHEISKALARGKKSEQRTKRGEELIAYLERGTTGFGEVSRLLREGADPNYKNPEGKTPLFCAAWTGHESAVDKLLEAGAKVDERCVAGMTALMAAAQKGHVRIFERLIDAGADIDIVDGSGRTLMDYARTGRSQAILRILDDIRTRRRKPFFGKRPAASPRPANIIRRLRN